MTPAFALADLVAALRALEPKIRGARSFIGAGALAAHLDALEDQRADAIAAIKVASAPAPTTNLGSLLRERARFARGGAR